MLLLVKQGIQHDRIIVAGITALEHVEVMVHSPPNRTLLIVSGYNPPHKELVEEELEAIFGTPAPTILLGDLNGKHTEWNNRSTNKQGKLLLQFCINRNITIKAPAEPIHFPAIGQPSVIDVVLAKGCALTDPISIPQLPSDHYPVVFKLRWTPKITSPRTYRRYETANWKLFQTRLSTLLREQLMIETPRDIDKEVETFTAAVLKAADEAMPMRGEKVNGLPIPPMVLTMIHFRNYLRRKYQRMGYKAHGIGFQLLNRVIDSHIRRHRKEKWNSFLSSLTPSNKNLWKRARYYKFERSPIPPLMYQGKDYNTAPEKAAIWLHSFNLLILCQQLRPSLATIKE